MTGYSPWGHKKLDMTEWLDSNNVAAADAAKSLQSCPTLCDPIDGSPLASPVPGILQPRTLEWVAISFFNAWKWKVKVKSLSRVRLLATDRKDLNDINITLSIRMWIKLKLKSFSKIRNIWSLYLNSALDLILDYSADCSMYVSSTSINFSVNTLRSVFFVFFFLFLHVYTRRPCTICSVKLKDFLVNLTHENISFISEKLELIRLWFTPFDSQEVIYNKRWRQNMRYFIFHIILIYHNHEIMISYTIIQNYIKSI